MSANFQFCNACSALSIADATSVLFMIDLLDNLSQQLARDVHLRFVLEKNPIFEFIKLISPSREAMGSSTPSIWPHLHMLWSTSAAAHSHDLELEDHLLPRFCLAIARFTRNIVAAVPSNQTEALSVSLSPSNPRLHDFTHDISSESQ